MEYKFYVYRLFDDEAVTLYIGKGSGNRLRAQKRKWRAKGEIIEFCKTEKEAFRREIELIAQLKPTENKHPGGQGGHVGARQVIDKIERAMILEGPRRYVAKMLLRFDPAALGKYLTAAQMSQIQAIAEGPRV